MDWCVNTSADQLWQLVVFTQLRQAPEHEESCVYVHCRPKTDRTGFTVYAFVRASFDYDDDRARHALGTRVGHHGWPVANVDSDEDGSRA